ncbi:MAG: hypothetical protein ACRC1W_13310, partial [Shewanella sp.]
MFVLTCQILIQSTTGTLTFNQVHEITIEKSWRDLVYQKATVKLPKADKLRDKIKIGDAISISLGYTGASYAQGIREEFTGFVKRIKPNTPFEIECEDEIYLFRKVKLNKTWSKKDKATLKIVVGYIFNEVKKAHPTLKLTLSAALPEVNFTEGFTIENGTSAAQALQQLREAPTGLTVYIRKQELFVGLAYQQSLGVVKHSLGQNIIDSDLEYRNADDVSLRVKAIGISRDNKKVEVIVPKNADADAEERTLYFYSVTKKEELEKLATNEIHKLRYTGYRGDFT